MRFLTISACKKRKVGTLNQYALMGLAMLNAWYLLAVFPNGVWAQTSGSLAEIYVQLDRRLEAGEGRLPARPRPKVDPSTRFVLPATEAEPNTFQAKGRQQLREERDSTIAAAQQRMQEDSRIRLEAFRQEVLQACGTDRLKPAEIGMPEKIFLNCSVEGRSSAITQVVSATGGPGSATLYGFEAGPVQKIYVVDGFIRAMRAPLAGPPLPELQAVTLYPERHFHPHVVALAAGEYFVFGQNRGEDWGLPAAQTVSKLMQTTNRSSSSVDAEPLQWDARLKGWRRLPRSPQCDGNWYLHTLAVLPDGRVLVAGGLCDTPRLANEPAPFEPHLGTSIWNPTTHAWAAAPKLRQARIYHTATVMLDGSVMLLGGLGDPLHTSTQEPLDSAESLSGADNFPLNSMAYPRAKHSATLLADGSVLAIGGQGRNTATLSAVERWNRLSRSWETRAPMLEPRYAHTANLLLDGRILVAGGIGVQGEALNTTEFYDPERNSWTAGPPLPRHLKSHTGAVLADGTVVLAGGLTQATGEQQPWLHVLYPGQSRWQQTGSRLTTMPDYALSHRPLIVPSGRGNALLFVESGVMYWRNPGASATTAPLQTVQPGATAALDDVPAMSARLLSAQDLQAPVLAAPTPLPPPKIKSRWARFIDGLRASPITGPLLGILAVLLLLAALKRWRSTPSVKAPTASPVWKWVVRLGVFGALLAFGLPHLFSYFALTSRDMKDECAANPGACLDSERHLLMQQSAVPDESKSARPRIPCAFVGIWTMHFKGRPLRFALNADGTYKMSSSAPGPSMNHAGHWVVQGKYMVWRSTLHGGNEADINRIVSNNGQRFELVETNGIHSHFERVEALPEASCERAK